MRPADERGHAAERDDGPAARRHRPHLRSDGLTDLAAHAGKVIGWLKDRHMMAQFPSHPADPIRNVRVRSRRRRPRASEACGPCAAGRPRRETARPASRGACSPSTTDPGDRAMCSMHSASRGSVGADLAHDPRRRRTGEAPWAPGRSAGRATRAATSWAVPFWRVGQVSPLRCAVSGSETASSGSHAHERASSRTLGVGSPCGAASPWPGLVSLRRPEAPCHNGRRTGPGAVGANGHERSLLPLFALPSASAPLPYRTAAAFGPVMQRGRGRRGRPTGTPLSAR